MPNEVTNTDQSLWKLKSFPDKIVEDEDIILITREDMVILFARALVLFLVFFAMLLLRTFMAGALGEIAMGLFDTAFYGVNILLILYFAYIFHNYYLSLQVVTSERIIDIDQQGIFKREVNELPIDALEDASYKQSGFFSTIFNYGNVILQTAGTSSGTSEDNINGFVFNNVPHPAQIKDIISTMYLEDQRGDFEISAEAHAEALKDILGKE